MVVDEVTLSSSLAMSSVPTSYTVDDHVVNALPVLAGASIGFLQPSKGDTDATDAEILA